MKRAGILSVELRMGALLFVLCWLFISAPEAKAQGSVNRSFTVSAISNDYVSINPRYDCETSGWHNCDWFSNYCWTWDFDIGVDREVTVYVQAGRSYSIVLRHEMGYAMYSEAFTASSNGFVSFYYHEWNSWTACDDFLDPPPPWYFMGLDRAEVVETIPVHSTDIDGDGAADEYFTSAAWLVQQPNGDYATSIGLPTGFTSENSALFVNFRGRWVTLTELADRVGAEVADVVGLVVQNGVVTATVKQAVSDAIVSGVVGWAVGKLNPPPEMDIALGNLSGVDLVPVYKSEYNSQRIDYLGVLHWWGVKLGDGHFQLQGNAAAMAKVKVYRSPRAGEPAMDWGEKLDIQGAGAIRNLHVEGINPSASLDDVEISVRYIPAKASLAGVVSSELSQPEKLTVYEVKAKEVSFAGPTQKIVKDTNASFEYTAPQYLDANKNGTIESGEKNYPVAYVRNTNPSIGGRLDLNVALPGQAIKLRVKGPGGVEVAEKTADGISGAEIRLNPTTSVGPLADTIDYFSANTAGKEFALVWEVKVGGGPWIDAGTTKHTVYVTLGSTDLLAQTSPISRQQSVYEIGCRFAENQTTGQGAVTALWNGFKNRDVKRAEDNEVLTYYKRPYNPSCPVDVASFLQGRDGRCGAWARFMRDVIKVQGIGGAEFVTIVPKTRFGYQAVGFYVKHYEATSLPLPNTPIPKFGTAGQNEPDPSQSYFTDHALVRYNGVFYDPSYGGSSFATLYEWQVNSLEAINWQSTLSGLPDRKIIANVGNDAWVEIGVTEN